MHWLFCCVEKLVWLVSLPQLCPDSSQCPLKVENPPPLPFFSLIISISLPSQNQKILFLFCPLGGQPRASLLLVPSDTHPHPIVCGLSSRDSFKRIIFPITGLQQIFYCLWMELSKMLIGGLNLYRRMWEDVCISLKSLKILSHWHKSSASLQFWNGPYFLHGLGLC